MTATGTLASCSMRTEDVISLNAALAAAGATPEALEAPDADDYWP
jgi:hypothetical protein